jgi:hypothetical protein
MTNGIDAVALERIAEQAVGHYGWLLLGAFAALMGKDVLVNFVQGLVIYWGSDFSNDEILYISGRQARVIRLGLTATTFFMTDRGTKMIVPNSQLKELTVEKKLPVNGGASYLPKGDETGVMKVEVVNEKGERRDFA